MHQLIKYANRKIYSRTKKAYVNLGELENIYKTETINVMEHVTKKDITEQIIASIVFNLLEKNPELSRSVLQFALNLKNLKSTKEVESEPTNRVD